MMFLSRPSAKNLGGGGRDRTDDPLLAKQVLPQLSYAPFRYLVDLGGLGPPTSRLSSARSNQLSYKPLEQHANQIAPSKRSFARPTGRRGSCRAPAGASSVAAVRRVSDIQ